jgi:two-component system LytT family response regulator
MKKVVIIDDEEAGRKLIKEYLVDYKQLILVGEANNGVDAIQLINKFRPDLIFLDIQMPGMTGFEVLGHLEEIPRIIFSTAYDQYALKAFEIHAVDYLLKPYTKERFKAAIEKANKEDQSDQAGPLVESVLMDKQEFPSRILVQSGKKLITIAVSNIQRIEAEGDYSKLVLAERSHLSNYGISKLENRLDPNTFVRVHRSSIINLNHIDSVEKHTSSYDVKMKNGDVVRVSRGYMENLKNFMY